MFQQRKILYIEELGWIALYELCNEYKENIANLFFCCKVTQIMWELCDKWGD